MRLVGSIVQLFILVILPKNGNELQGEAHFKTAMPVV